MQKSTVRRLRRGALLALAMTAIVTSGCGGGDSGGAAAVANSPPTIAASPATRVIVGQAYSLAPAANDADGDMLAFSIQNKPAWAQFSTATGRLTGTPNAQSAGATSNIVISVSDGKVSASLSAFSITVAAAGAPPPPSGASANSVALSWDVPTRTIDGATLSDLSGYRIHYGTNANALVRAIELKSSGQNNFTVQNLPAGTYYFAVRAITDSGVESRLSNVISRVVS